MEHFLIQRRKSRAKKRICIECPIYPTSETLKISESVSLVGVFKRSDSQNKITLRIRRHCDSHRIGVDIKANDGKRRTKHLLSLFVRNFNFIKQKKQFCLFVR